MLLSTSQNCHDGEDVFHVEDILVPDGEDDEDGQHRTGHEANEAGQHRRRWGHKYVHVLSNDKKSANKITRILTQMWWENYLVGWLVGTAQPGF